MSKADCLATASHSLGFQGVVEALAHLGSSLFPEEPGCVQVENEGQGVFRLTINSDDKAKADSVAMDILTIVDVISPYFEKRLHLRY